MPEETKTTKRPRKTTKTVEESKTTKKQVKVSESPKVEDAKKTTKTRKTTSTASKSSESTTKKTRKTTKKAEPSMSAGDASCYVYFDAKLTSNKLDSDIISLCLIDYMGNVLYAEFNDFDKSKVSDKNAIYVESKINPENNSFDEHIYIINDSKELIRMEVLKWLETVMEGKKNIQIVTDNNYLGFCKFIDLITNGEGIDKIPVGISKCIYDINQDIATSIQRTNNKNLSIEEFNKDYIPNIVASEVDRFDFINSFNKLNSDKNRNTSLSTAMCALIIHQYMWNL